MELKTVKISDLKQHPKNPNTHPQEQITELQDSLEQFDQVKNIVVWQGQVIAGNGLLMAAKKQGRAKIEVQDVSDWPEEKAISFMISDNRLAELAIMDDDLLSDLLKDFDDPLDIPGIDENFLDELDIGTGSEGGNTDPDEVPEVAKSVVKSGELWLLGNHRLLCGDCTRIENVERLMDGTKSDMIFCDPPYNVDYGVSKKPRHKIRTIKNDKQTPKEWEAFCKSLFLIFKENNNGDIYMWGASSPEGMKMRLWLVEFGCHWSATIIWKKQQLVLSPAKYQRMYEPCFYGWFEKSSFGEDRTQTEVWEIDRPLNSKLHPTMKPVELCIKGIKNSSKIGGSILDLFGGSGSTLMACEQTNRKCMMMEIESYYSTIILQRWADYTGKDPVREDGIKFSELKNILI